MLLQQLRELESYTNTRSQLPGVAQVHVSEDGAAYAGDGDVELYMPESGLPPGKWSADAQQLVNMLKVAGPDAVLALDQGSVLVSSADFSGRVQMSVPDPAAVSLHALFSAKGEGTVVALPSPAAFTDALLHVAPFASSDPSAGGHWTGVLLRGGATLAASILGFHVAQAILDNSYREDDSPDVIIPARAALAAAKAGMIVALCVNDALGIGAFQLENGHMVYFKLLMGPVQAGKAQPYPPVDDVLNAGPGDDSYANGGQLLAHVERVSIVAGNRNPSIVLEYDAQGWYLACQGNGEASIALPEFAPQGEPAPTRLSPDLWRLALVHGSELAPVGDLWFRSRYELAVATGKEGYLLRGVMSGMAHDLVADEPQEEPAAEEKGKGKGGKKKSTKKGK